MTVCTSLSDKKYNDVTSQTCRSIVNCVLARSHEKGMDIVPHDITAESDVRMLVTESPIDDLPSHNGS